MNKNDDDEFGIDRERVGMPYSGFHPGQLSEEPGMEWGDDFPLTVEERHKLTCGDNCGCPELADDDE